MERLFRPVAGRFHGGRQVNSGQMQTESALLLIEESEDYRLTLTSDSLQLECRAQLEIFPPQEELPDSEDKQLQYDEQPTTEPSPDRIRHPPLLTPPDLLWILQKHAIIDSIDYAALYEFCADIDRNQEPETRVLARGVAPQKGDDGWFELLVKPFGSAIELHEDAEGRVDPKNLNTYTAIETGRKLGLVHSPKQGIPGRTVQGQPIPAEAGSPYQLKAGDGVVLKFDDRVAFAERAGQAVLNKNTLSVVELLTISGDVDLSVGDIHFNGLVDIKGEVPDDFDVKAGKGLLIHGPVGACQIESGGDLELTSMAGKEVGTIICRGDLRARFLNQVNVYCYGNLYVSGEIRNCRIKTTGSILVERGAVIGGSCVAYGGIEAQTFGAPSGQTTLLTAGLYFPDADRFAYLRQRRGQIEQQLISIGEAIAPLKKLIKNNPQLADTAETRLILLQEQVAKLEEERRRTQHEMRASATQEPEGRNAKINAHKKIWDGVRIKLGQADETLKQELRGPLSVIENSTSGGLRFLPLTNLAISTEELEDPLEEQTESTPPTQGRAKGS